MVLHSSGCGGAPKASKGNLKDDIYDILQLWGGVVGERGLNVTWIKVMVFICILNMRQSAASHKDHSFVS